MSSICIKMNLQVKLIFMKAMHDDSFWHRDKATCAKMAYQLLENDLNLLFFHYSLLIKSTQVNPLFTPKSASKWCSIFVSKLLIFACCACMGWRVRVTLILIIKSILGPYLKKNFIFSINKIQCTCWLLSLGLFSLFVCFCLNVFVCLACDYKIGKRRVLSLKCGKSTMSNSYCILIWSMNYIVQRNVMKWSCSAALSSTEVRTFIIEICCVRWVQTQGRLDHSSVPSAVALHVALYLHSLRSVDFPHPKNSAEESGSAVSPFLWETV